LVVGSPTSPEEGADGKREGSRRIRIKSQRFLLFLYLISIAVACLYLIIFVWDPTPAQTTIDENTTPTTVPSNKTINNGTKVNAAREPANITTKTTTFQNATTILEIKDEFHTFENGSTSLVKSTEKALKANLTGFLLPNTLASPNKEVRLVSLAALFGMLGGAVSGINSVLTKRIWDTGKYVNIRRLLFNYYSRPWVAMAIGIITYVAIRAGLVNVGSGSEQVTALSEFGVAAIGALVGLMADEIITRLRDIFRALFGITSLQNDQELQLSLQKSSIKKDDQTSISAILTNIKPSQNHKLVAYFFIQDTTVINFDPPSKSEEKFSSTGVASVIIKGIKPGKSYITVMLLGDSSLYDTQQIEVESEIETPGKNPSKSNGQ
jgi:hypothetical protein